IVQKDSEKNNPISLSSPLLYIYPEKTSSELNYRLIYKTEANYIDESWNYTLDANTGEIIQKGKMGFTATGQGTRFETNPGNGDAEDVTLYFLSSGTYYLMNPKITAKYVDPDPVSHEEYVSDNYRDYRCEPDPDGDIIFGAVNAYYHTDKFRKWLVNQLGMSASYPSWNTILVTEGYTPYMAAGSFGSGNYTIIYDKATNPSYEWKDPSYEASVIVHEYMHLIILSYNYCFPSDGTEYKSMHESYSDYFGMAYHNKYDSSYRWGEWVDIPGGNRDIFRDLSNNHKYGEWDEIEIDRISGTSYYDRCVILSGALWDFRNDPDVNSETASELILESIALFDDEEEFIDARYLLIDAAADAGYSQYYDDIHNAFDAHGILPIRSYVSGTTEMQEIVEQGNWTCTNNGCGIPPYDYQWYMTTQTYGTEAVGSNQPTLSLYAEESFSLLCQITDDDGNISINHGLEVTVTPYNPKAAGGSYPREYGLAQNYPNPFNPVTEIKYQLPKASSVTLSVYNLLGQEVAKLVDMDMPAGYHSVKWDASRVASGTYIYKIVAGEFTAVKKMVVIK
ncbi:T9SS type A sorting domain-containing protein, partial [candidate division KSB1 bacterium]